MFLLSLLIQAPTQAEVYPRFFMRELVTGPQLIAEQRHDLIYRKTTELRYDDRGQPIPQSHITRRLGWCTYGVTEGEHFGEPCRVVRWYTRYKPESGDADADVEHRFYVTLEGKILRQVSRSTYPKPRLANILVTDAGLQVMVSDADGNRGFDLELADLKPYVNAFVPYESGTKEVVLYDPFRNGLSRFTVSLASYFTDSWDGRRYKGKSYAIDKGKLYLTDSGKPFRCELSEFVGFEPFVEGLRSK